MGMLDRIVSGLIKNATGVDARRAVRKIGGRNILLAGGAMLAGGMLAQQARGTSGGGPLSSAPTRTPPRSGTSSATPPPPPVPGAVPPPPPVPGAAPPPLPDVATDDNDDPPPRMLAAIVRTLVAGAMADGHLADDERRLVDEQLTGSVLAPEQVAQIRLEMRDPASPRDLASLASNDDERATLYRFAVLVVRADGRSSAMEEGWLGRFAEALGIADEQRSALEAEVSAAATAEGV